MKFQQYPRNVNDFEIDDDVLEMLTPRQKTVYKKRYVEKKTRKEICKEFGFSNTNLTSHINRIKKKAKDTATKRDKIKEEMR